jgi:membrane protein DedA with SNARE-associated domain
MRFSGSPCLQGKSVFPFLQISFSLTAGALVHHGETNLGLVMCMGVLGCLAGDLV